MLAALSVSAVVGPNAAAVAAGTPATSKASSPAKAQPKAVQLETTLRQFIAAASKSAADRDGAGAAVTHADLQAALSSLGKRAWEKDVPFTLVQGFSADLNAISMSFTEDGRLGVALSSGGGACSLAVFDPGSKKATVWAFDQDLGKNCSGAVALNGQTNAAPSFLDPVAPDAVTGVVVRPGDESLTVTWDTSTAADLSHYVVRVDGELVAQTDQHEFTVVGLKNGTDYEVTVSAVDTADNESVLSSAVVGRPADLIAPEAPVTFNANAGDGEVSLEWAASISEDIDHYVIFMDGKQHAVTTQTGYTVTGLTNYESHTYAMAAVDEAGNRSIPTDAVAIESIDLTAPEVPSGLSVTPGDSNLTLVWSPVRDADLDHYNVYLDGVRVATTNEATYTFTGLDPDVTYNVTVDAVDRVGNKSAVPASVAGQPLDLTAPDAPTEFGAVPGEESVALSWAPSTAKDFDHYEVVQDGNVVASTTDVTYTVTGVINGVDHTYVVRAVDRHGNISADSTAITARAVDLTAPSPVTDLKATTPEVGQVVLTWTGSTSTDVDHYEVINVADMKVMASIAAGVNTFTVVGLDDDTDYTFAVVAIDAAGNAVSGPTVKAHTLKPAAPSIDPIQAAKASGMFVRDSARTADGGSYFITSAACTGQFFDMVVNNPARCTFDNFVFKVDKANHVEWMVHAANGADNTGTQAQDPTILPDGDLLIIGSSKMVRLNAQDGTIVWAKAFPRPAANAGIMVHNVAYDAVRERLLMMNTQFGYTASVPPYQFGASTISVNPKSMYGALYLTEMDPATGDLRGSVPLGTSTATSGTDVFSASFAGGDERIQVAPDGTIYVGASINGSTLVSSGTWLGQSFSATLGSNTLLQIAALNPDLSVRWVNKVQQFSNTTYGQRVQYKGFKVAADGNLVIAGDAAGEARIGAVNPISVRASYTPTSGSDYVGNSSFLATFNATNGAVKGVAKYEGTVTRNTYTLVTGATIQDIAVMPNGHVAALMNTTGETAAVDPALWIRVTDASGVRTFNTPYVKAGGVFTGVRAEAFVAEYDPATNKVVAQSNYRHVGMLPKAKVITVKADNSLEVVAEVGSTSNTNTVNWFSTTDEPLFITPAKTLANYVVSAPAPSADSSSTRKF